MNLFHNQKSDWSLVTGLFCFCIVKCAISDSNRYVGITPDKYLNHVINGAKKSKELFRDLLDNDRINKDEYDKICPKGSRPGIFYGNLKIYKPVPKFWPILLAINAARCNIAKFLIPILELLTHNEFTIKDSFNFAKEITTYSLLYIASLDVESLFTDISLNEASDNCVKDLQNENLYNGKLSKRGTLSNF